MQIGSEDKAAALPKQKRNLELFGHKGFTKSRGRRGPPVDLKRLVSGD